MSKLILFNCLLILGIVLLAILLIHFSKLGVLGYRLKFFSTLATSSVRRADTTHPDPNLNIEQSKKSHWNSIKKGISKAHNHPMLPVEIQKLHDHILVRALRVIGGVCFLLTVSQNYELFIFPLDYFIIVIAIIHNLYIMYINAYKIKYSWKSLFNKDLEVRNSPLDSLASKIGRIYFCFKIGCGAGLTGGTILGVGVSVDQILDNWGEPRVFSPFLFLQRCKG